MIDAEVLRRLTNLQAELSALVAALAREGPASGGGSRGATAATAASPAAPPTPAPAAPAPALEARVRKARWSYRPGTLYRVVGGNPFREGNNYNLFASLADNYGDRPFTREQLGEQITALRSAGAIDSTMDEEGIVIGFLQVAGADKGRIVMGERGGPGSDGDEELPPEAGG